MLKLPNITAIRSALDADASGATSLATSASKCSEFSAEKVHLTDGLVIQNINFKPVDGTLIYPHICFILYHL